MPRNRREYTYSEKDHSPCIDRRCLADRIPLRFFSVGVIDLERLKQHREIGVDPQEDFLRIQMVDWSLH